jgi:sialate O-acetylesterase
MQVEKKGVRIYFNDAPNGLSIKGGAPSDFEIAGVDKVFYPAKAKIEGNTILVWSDKVKVPVAVRFGFNNTAQPNLFSKEGLPVLTFRTDKW